MATPNNNLTIVDHIQRLDPNGAMAYIIETLSKQTPVFEDAVFKEGNLPDGHKFTSRNSLPPVGRRRINKGTPGGKSGAAQVKEPTTALIAKSVIDVEEADLNGDRSAFRASEDIAFLQAMMQKADSAMLYDNHQTDPDQCTGLLPRLNSTTDPTAGKQIVKWSDPGAGVSHTCASLILVGWGDQTIHGIYPKGTMAGLSHKDMGEQYEPDDNGDRFRALVAEWTLKLGVAVKDSRFLAAVRNIDMATITEGTASAPVNDLIRAAVHGYYKIYAPGSVKLCWYAPRALAQYLHLQALSSVAHGAALTIENVDGRPITKLCGAPIRISDSMTTTEDSIA